ncbi:MAG: hypothetical protein ACI4SM_03390 [Candidatus Gastranaerophilaceae bacterium]
MERLTIKTPEGYDLKVLEYAYCDNYCDVQSEDSCKNCGIYEAIQKLAEYEDLEEQGLLFRLPVKIGDTMYTNIKTQSWLLVKEEKPYEVNVAFISIDEESAFINVVYKNNSKFKFELSEIGKTIFITKAEAEAKLKELERREKE